MPGMPPGALGEPAQMNGNAGAAGPLTCAAPRVASGLVGLPHGGSKGMPSISGGSGPQSQGNGFGGRSSSKNQEGTFGSKVRGSIMGFEGSSGFVMPRVRATSLSYV